MRRVLSCLAVAVAVVSPFVQAQKLQPGLWQVDSSNMQVGGQKLPDTDVMLDQLQALAPEQRQMLDQALKNQGVNLHGKGVQVCLTPAQAQSEQIPMRDAKSGCTQQVTERSAQAWKFHFSCPQAQGNGVVKFISDREFNATIVGSFTANGTQQSGSTDTHGVWQGRDCGTVQPR